MTDTRPRLWETPQVGADTYGSDASDAPEIVRRLADAISIDAGPQGFTISNSAASDATALVTLMARTRGVDESEARAQLAFVTSSSARSAPLWIGPGSGEDAYERLWLDDVHSREHAGGGWVAMRSGAIVVPLHAQTSVLLSRDAGSLGGGVVVASVAAVSAGLSPESPLRAVEFGSSASIGERPVVVTS